MLIRRGPPPSGLPIGIRRAGGPVEYRDSKVWTFSPLSSCVAFGKSRNRHQIRRELGGKNVEFFQPDKMFFPHPAKIFVGERQTADVGVSCLDTAFVLKRAGTEAVVGRLRLRDDLEVFPSIFPNDVSCG